MPVTKLITVVPEIPIGLIMYIAMGAVFVIGVVVLAIYTWDIKGPWSKKNR